MLARDNPFRTRRIGALAFRHPELSLAGILDRLAGQGSRGAIVGPHGSGKTTLLGEIAEHLTRAGLRVERCFLNAEMPPPRARELALRARTLGPGDALLFDGAGHLPGFHWRRLLRASRNAGAFVVTAHEEGRLPTLLRTRTDTRLLAELVEDLTATGSEPLRPLLDELYDAHGGNLREALLALYDLSARDALPLP
jgi:hypothetical protein